MTVKPNRTGPSVPTAGQVESPEGPSPRRLGRPRDARAAPAILDAVVEVLSEVGFVGLTVDAVAQRAGVGKATIYRRWDTKEQLVLAAVSTERYAADIPDSGDLRADLTALYRPLTEPLAQQKALRLLPALVAEAAVNDDLAAKLRVFMADRRMPSLRVLEQARSRGELREGVDLELCVDLAIGSMLHRLMFTRAVVDLALVDSLVDMVWRAVQP